MPFPRRQRGALLVLILLAIALAFGSAGVLALSSASAAAARERASERALAQAREALVAHAADRPIDARLGPGYLPCPDLDDDGWAEPTCGSLTGEIGQRERLGRLPWKTLGLPDLRDGHGERLWYAVSTRYKGLLNCAASGACVAGMTPEAALGTITLRGPGGSVLHDGTLADPARAADGGAAAVVIAPGPAIARADGHVQRRECVSGECDPRGRCIADPPWHAARCDPRNYLDIANGEDNAAFHDRSDAAGRAGNADGFAQGPVAGDAGLAMNDRVAAIAYPDVMARTMARVGLELAHCVRLHAAGEGLPAPEGASCSPSPHLGPLPDAALVMAGCNASAGPSGWWAAWRPYVLYARAGTRGIEVVDARGVRLAAGRRFALLVTRRPADCPARQIECDAEGCFRAVLPMRSRDRHDALVAMP